MKSQSVFYNFDFTFHPKADIITLQLVAATAPGERLGGGGQYLKIFGWVCSTGVKKPLTDSDQNIVKFATPSQT